MRALEALASYVATVRALNRNVRLLLAAQGLSWLGGAGMFYVLANLYLLRLGFSTEYIGLANALMMLGMAAVSLPAGELGRRPTTRLAIAIGLGAYAATYMALALAWLLPPTLRPGWLLLQFLLGGLTYSVAYVNMPPFLMGSTAGADRAHAFSLFSAITTASGFLGALLGGLLPGLVARTLGVTLADPAPYGVCLLVAALFFVPATLLLLPAREPQVDQTAEADSPEDAPRTSPENRSPVKLIGLMSVVMLIYWLGRGPIYNFWNVYFDSTLRLSTALIGSLSAIAQLVGIPAALAAPLLMGHLGNVRAFALPALLTAACVAFLALASSWQAAGVGYIALATLSSLSAPAISVVHQSIVAGRWRGTMSGAVSTAATLGLGATALASGYVIAAAGYRPLFLLAAAFLAVAALLFWAWFGRGVVAPAVSAAIARQ